MRMIRQICIVMGLISKICIIIIVVWKALYGITKSRNMEIRNLLSRPLVRTEVFQFCGWGSWEAFVTFEPIQLSLFEELSNAPMEDEFKTSSTMTLSFRICDNWACQLSLLQNFLLGPAKVEGYIFWYSRYFLHCRILWPHRELFSLFGDNWLIFVIRLCH